MVTEMVIMTWPVESRPREDRNDTNADLLGLGRKPQETPAGRPVKPDRMNPRTREAILLTVRRDLTTIREKLLSGASRRVLLGELDYTIDALDNTLAEM